jgi:hypothetical protein
MSGPPPSPERIVAALRTAIGAGGGQGPRPTPSRRTTQNDGVPSGFGDDEKPGPLQKEDAEATKAWVEETVDAFRAAGGEIWTGAADDQAQGLAPRTRFPKNVPSGRRGLPPPRRSRRGRLRERPCLAEQWGRKRASPMRGPMPPTTSRWRSVGPSTRGEYGAGGPPRRVRARNRPDPLRLLPVRRRRFSGSPVVRRAVRPPSASTAYLGPVPDGPAHSFCGGRERHPITI